MQKAPQLPDNMEELKALLTAQLAANFALQDQFSDFKTIFDSVTLERDYLKASKVDDVEEIKRLKLLLEKLQRMLFGQKSEKLVIQIQQIELELEELHINQGLREANLPEKQEADEPKGPKNSNHVGRRPLPAHLLREIKEYLPADPECPDCGGAWQRLGEDVSEVLEYVPASYRVIRQVRPQLSCTCCERMAQATAPSRPFNRGLFGPGLLSHVMVAKYVDHLPLYRQCQQSARENVALSESTLGDAVGQVHGLLRPLMNALHQYVFAASKLHADDTPIQVLAPGNGKTKQGRLWVYARDDRPSGQTTAPAVWFRYSPDRKGIHPQVHLKDYSGVLQADAYAGYNAVYASGKVIEAACWAHARRKFYDLHASNPTKITTYVLEQIKQLYTIESAIRGSPPERRREVRQEQSKPLVLGLDLWLKATLLTVSQKSAIADAIKYAMNQWQALSYFLENGLVEMDNNAAERALRTVALGRKNYLFLGSDAGGERAATMYSLMGTVKLNNMNPEAYLTHVLKVIADYPVNRVEELLPWNIQL